MTGNPGGRHRAPKRSGATPVLVGGALILALLLAGGSVAWFATRNESVPAPTSSAVATDSGAGGLATLVSARVIEVKGSVVTVRETTSVFSGGPITVAPSNQLPATGLTVSGTVVAGEDGTNQPFTGPVTLVSGRSITIEGQYRLKECPDLLPTEWPTPVTVVPGNWSRTFSRVEAPQRTARSLCPGARSKAKQIRILRGSMVQGGKPVVRLRWLGNTPVTVSVIGSASGVAAIGGGGRCPGGCVAVLKPDSSVRVRLRPLEECPVAGKTNWLTVGLVVGKGPMRTAGLNIASLGQGVCG